MQTSLNLGSSDVAAKRAGKLSPRQAMIIGAAANSIAGSGPIYRYAGFIGFAMVNGTFTYIGPGGALRVSKTELISGGSPRRLHAALPSTENRLIRVGRQVVAQCDVKPATYRDLVALAGIRSRYSYATPDHFSACEALRAAVDKHLGR